MMKTRQICLGAALVATVGASVSVTAFAKQPLSECPEWAAVETTTNSLPGWLAMGVPRALGEVQMRCGSADARFAVANYIALQKVLAAGAVPPAGSNDNMTWLIVAMISEQAEVESVTESENGEVTIVGRFSRATQLSHLMRTAAIAGEYRQLRQVDHMPPGEGRFEVFVQPLRAARS